MEDLMAKEKKEEVQNATNAATAAEESQNDTNAQLEQMKSFITEKLSKLDSQVKDISNNIKNKYIPQAENKIKENMLTSLAVSFVSGLCIGLVLMLLSLLGGNKRR